MREIDDRGLRISDRGGKVARMTREERLRIESLDAVLRPENVRAQIRPIVERVRAELGRKKAALMAWEPIPLTVFGGALPFEIRSAWVFVLRAGVDTGAERHPNSHQRMMSFEGGWRSPNWQARSLAIECLVSNPEAPLERRWISVPRNCWHRPLVSAGSNWAVVSFHTAPADELIEEKPDATSKDGTKQMKYSAQK